MLIVIDANVICSALIAKGKTIDILFSEKIEAIAPELLFTEVGRHETELLEKTKLSKKDFDILLSLFNRRIMIIPICEFKDTLKKSKELLKEHTKDMAYVALALKYKCPLWSKEKRLKKVVKTLDADEIERRIH